MGSTAFAIIRYGGYTDERIPRHNNESDKYGMQSRVRTHEADPWVRNPAPT
jgi:hypothetical protein